MYTQCVYTIYCLCMCVCICVYTVCVYNVVYVSVSVSGSGSVLQHSKISFKNIFQGTITLQAMYLGLLLNSVTSIFPSEKEF